MDWYNGIQMAKDPDAVLDYEVDFTDWLVSGDSLSTHSVDAGGLTLDSSAINGDSVIFWLSGGTVGTSYTVTVTVTTSGGRTDDRSVVFVVGER